jgi:hypothetical protein
MKAAHGVSRSSLCARPLCGFDSRRLYNEVSWLVGFRVALVTLPAARSTERRGLAWDGEALHRVSALDPLHDVDVVRGMEPGGVLKLVGCSFWPSGCTERWSSPNSPRGTSSSSSGAHWVGRSRRPYERAGVSGEIAQSSGGFFFVWPLIALGLPRSSPSSSLRAGFGAHNGGSPLHARCAQGEVGRPRERMSVGVA